MRNFILTAATSLLLGMGITIGIANHKIDEVKAEKVIVEQELVTVTNALVEKDEELSKIKVELAKITGNLKIEQENNVELSKKLKSTKSTVDKLSTELEQEKRKK